jgi:hypothetical protein
MNRPTPTYESESTTTVYCPKCSWCKDTNTVDDLAEAYEQHWDYSHVPPPFVPVADHYAASVMYRWEEVSPDDWSLYRIVRGAVFGDVSDHGFFVGKVYPATRFDGSRLPAWQCEDVANRCITSKPSLDEAKSWVFFSVFDRDMRGFR